MVLYLQIENLQNVNIVWLKRDLRIEDHAPLYAAVEEGKDFLVIYIFEPSMQQYPDWDIRHWRFVFQSLMDLQNKNVPVCIFYGEARDVFIKLHKTYNLAKVFSHQETGNSLSFDRDLNTKSLFTELGIHWIEFPNYGIIRGKQNRINWKENWLHTMSQSIKNPDMLKSSVKPARIPHQFQMPPELYNKLRSEDQAFQHGGETMAKKLLDEYLNMHQYKNYNKYISKPEESRTSCSRLSPYLAWGNISIRTVVQKIETLLASDPPYRQQLMLFYSRIHWNQHFIQKFESESRMETENLNKGFDLLPKHPDESKITAWKLGLTGIPLVDACMRAVSHTGYINFRMRAMLVSFLTHHLWQPWQSGAYHLARQFLDYEPGIHYPQFQMQAGTTGVNTLRIYNPVKNALEHDSQATFIKKWVPELKELPTPFAIEPWKLSYLEEKFYNFTVGVHYPKPIVNLHESQKKASDILWYFKDNPEVRRDNIRILQKHTFRKSTKDQQSLFID